MGGYHRLGKLDTVTEKQDQMYAALFEQGHDFALLVEPEGFVVAANDAALELVEADRADVLMKRLWNTPWLQQSAQECQVREDFQRAVGGQSVRRTIRIGTGQSQTILNTVVHPITDQWGSVDYLMITGIEITDIQRQIAELEEENEYLEEFVRAATHDIRHLLAVAGGHIELATDETDADALGAAKDALERAETLIDDLSSLASERQLIGDRSTQKLAIIAKEAWHNVATANASLSIESSTQLAVDKSRLVELFENLYRNAVEHAGDGVTVRVGTFEDGFYVADDGPGLPDFGAEDPFEPGVTTADQGTGFGLSIVRTIAAAHGWDVRATAADDGGARFEILTETQAT